MYNSPLRPAIDVEASASRVMHNVASPQHLELARKFRNYYSRYMKSRDLIQLGAYAAGSDPETDRAIVLYPGLQRFLMQDMREAATMEHSLQQLAVAVQQQRVGRPVCRPDLGKRGQGQRRPGQQGQQSRHSGRHPCRDPTACHRPASTCIASLGDSPYISGAYMASTRVGGRPKRPTLFRRTVYSTWVLPLGR